MSVVLLLLPDFLLIGTGFALRRWAHFATPFWAGTERLIYYLLFPALLFRSLTHLAPLDESWLRLAFVALGFTLAGMLLGMAGKRLLVMPERQFAACYQCGFRFNTYIAMAVAGRVEGEAGLAGISLLVGLLVPVVNVGAVAMLARSQGARIFAELLRNPLVLACLGAFLWRATGQSLPEPLPRLLDLLAAAALPLGLLTVGAGLVLRRDVLPMSALIYWNGLKLLVLPAIAFALAIFFDLPPSQTRLAVIMAAVPTASSAYVLAMRLGGQGAPVALLISSGTLLGMMTLPLWLTMLGR